MSAANSVKHVDVAVVQENESVGETGVTLESTPLLKGGSGKCDPLMMDAAATEEIQPSTYAHHDSSACTAAGSCT